MFGLFKTDEEKGYGIISPIETNNYIMVRVGENYVRRVGVNDYNNNPLTNDYRQAKTYRKRKEGELFPVMNSFEKANKDKKLYGGEIVRVTVCFETIELED